MRRAGRPGPRTYAAVAAILVIGAAALAAWWLRPAPQALPWSTLRNATYPVSLRPSGVTLRDGLFEAEAAPGSASRIIVRLADLAAFGDLDGDADLDAAVTLVSSSGGSGTFVELAAVRNDGGSARPVAATLLGDRVLVREVRVEDGRILVRLRARGATDPFSRLSREISRHYVLDGDALRLADEAETDVPATAPEDFVYHPERVDLAVGASRNVSGSLAPGQIASYVVRGRAGETLDLSVRSEFNNAVLSVSSLTDGVALVTRRDYSVQRSIALGNDDDYAVKVVSLAGYQLPFTLTLQLRGASVSPTPTAQPTKGPAPSASPIASRPPAGAIADRPLGQLSAPAEDFARGRRPIWGVAVVVPSRGTAYAENADTQVPTASVVKVLVMLVVLEQARQDRRPPTEEELALLWPMITESDNDSTSQLWEHVGRGQAVLAYMRGIGVGGFTPDPAVAWGVSFVSARAMATVLAKLLAGDILDDPSRALAFRMLEGVVPEQRWGVSAGADTERGDRVAIKNGWYPGSEGWRVNSVGVVRPREGPSYAIAVVSDERDSWREGIETIEGIATRVNTALLGR